MGLWGLLVKSVEVSGETNDTFVSLLKKWNEIFQRSEIFEQIQSVEKTKDNPSTVDEACTTLVAPTFTLKFWNDTYCDLDEWACHSNRYKCDFSSWDEAYYQIHIEYSAKGMTLTLDYITGDEDDEDDGDDEDYDEEHFVHEWYEDDTEPATLKKNGVIYYACDGCEEIKEEII